MGGDKNYSLSYLGAEFHTSKENDYTTFSVETKHGIVAGCVGMKFAYMAFIFAGRKHTRKINRALTRRGIISAARRFAAQVAS